jgi:hypothetical protein
LIQRETQLFVAYLRFAPGLHAHLYARTFPKVAAAEAAEAKRKGEGGGGGGGGEGGGGEVGGEGGGGGGVFRGGRGGGGGGVETTADEAAAADGLLNATLPAVPWLGLLPCTGMVGPCIYRPPSHRHAFRILVSSIQWRAMTWRAMCGRPYGTELLPWDGNGQLGEPALPVSTLHEDVAVLVPAPQDGSARGAAHGRVHQRWGPADDARHVIGLPLPFNSTRVLNALGDVAGGMCQALISGGCCWSSGGHLFSKRLVAVKWV